MQNEVTKKLSESSNLHFQCDGWSNCRNESIINCIISVPDPLFVKFIETKENSHDATYLCNQMAEVMESMEPKNFFAAIGDNAVNMQAALNLLKVKYPHIEPLGCIPHLMHLLCFDILKRASAKKIEESKEEPFTMCNI